MYSVLKSFGLNGLAGFAVEVEADVSGGLPAFSIVGLPDSAVRESGDRVPAGPYPGRFRQLQPITGRGACQEKERNSVRYFLHWMGRYGMIF